MRRTAMPSIDDQLRTRMREAAPQPAGADDLVAHLGARKRRRAGVRRAGTVGLVVVVLVGTSGAFIALGRAFRTEPIPGTLPTPTQTPPDLGLGFPICDVMSMPITVAGAQGNAYVFTKAIDGCPKPGEGHRFVGADLDGNGTVDATAPELTDCFSPVGCEAFAAPDVNGDGTSEIAVSTAGADGYGVWLYAVTTSPAAVEPITVVDPQGIGNVQTGTLQFAWVDVVGHSGGARCETRPDGGTFTIFGVDKLDPNADVQLTDLRIAGATATVVGASHDRVPIADAPAPGNSLCGAPLYGSAANFPNAADSNTMDIGIGEPLCDVSTVVADFTGDGRDDTALVGMEGRNGRCTDAAEGTEIVAMDTTGDGLPDGGYFVNAGCLMCRAYAAADLDADGIPELIVLHQNSATPVYELIEAFVRSTQGTSLVPIMIGSDAPQMGLSAGQGVTLTAGGDEGSSFAIGCEGSPDSPIVVQWRSQHPVDGPGSDVRDVYETKLSITGTEATVVDSQHTTEPTSGPLPFDSLESSGCGVQWFPPE
jgi:hypothetical protein